MNKFFRAVGIEIEGGWRNVKRVHPWFKGDSSAIVPNFTHISHYGILGKHPLYDYPVCGEINSEPMESRVQIHRWLQNVYPEGFAPSCAIHVHSSFNSLKDYAKIMTKHFYDLFYKRMEEFSNDPILKADAAYSTFVDRLKGRIHWSGRGFKPLGSDGYIIGKYYALNFHAFKGDNFGRRRNQTYEMRLLPTFEKRATAHKAIKLYLDIIKEVLTINPPAEKEISNSLDILKTIAPEIPV